ncbi:MAG TPA: phage holin family protein [Gemmatimonadaceae bacterium]|nr:phage holin family protein [Gemmatimonadaceae bacterium]
MAANPLHIDPDVGIPDLIRRLSDDGKRLVSDEIRLVKIETKENVKAAGRGGIRLALAFGIGTVALVALTLLMVTLIGRLANGHMWVGALATGIVELFVAVMLIKRGAKALGEPSYTLEETRAGLSTIRHG